MKTKFLRVVSFLMAIAMAFSMASCTSSCDKDKKSKKKKNKKTPTTATVPVDEGSYYSYWSSASWGDIDEGDLYDDNDNFGNGTDSGDDLTSEDYQIVIARPEKDSDLEKGISTGEQLKYNDGDDLDDFDDLDDPDLGDIDDTITNDNLSLDNVASPIAKFGTATAEGDNVRTIDVANDEVVFKHFDGIGCNSFPTYSFLYSQVQDDGNKAYFELNYKRFNDVKHKYARNWFQIDWMITDEVKDDYVKYTYNYKDNKDYQNYMNGIYWLSEDNEMMESCIEYWKMLEEADTNVYVAFGWKIGTRIQHWFSEDPTRLYISAPKDTKRYADAAAKMFLYCQDRGLTNVNILAFYNEPARVEDNSWRGSWDFATVGDKRVVWANMVKDCYDVFKANDRLKDVKIASADGGSNLYNTEEKYVDVYLAKHAAKYIDIFTRHQYSPAITDYQLSYDNTGTDEEKFAKKKQAIIKNESFVYHNVYDFYNLNRYLFSPNEDGENPYSFHHSETYFYGYDIPDAPSREAGAYAWNINDPAEKKAYWNVSTTAMMVAAANTGIQSVYNWGTVGGTLYDPTSFLVADNNVAAWRFPKNQTMALDVRSFYYEYAIWNNYIPMDSNVHNITWTGDDIRGSAFSSTDGKDFSLLVEKSYDTEQLTYNINLAKSLGGKTIYIYRLINTPNITVDEDAQATVPKLHGTVSNVNKSITYTDTDEHATEYAVYVFTTIKPLKQLELYQTEDETKQAVSLTVTKDEIAEGKQIKITPKRIDTPAADTLKWEIVRYYNAPVQVAKGETAPYISYHAKDFKVTEYKSVRRHEIEGADCGTITQNGDSVVYTFPADGNYEIGDTIALRCTVVDDTPNNTADDRYASCVIEIVKGEND